MTYNVFGGTLNLALSSLRLAGLSLLLPQALPTRLCSVCVWRSYVRLSVSNSA